MLHTGGPNQEDFQVWWAIEGAWRGYCPMGTISPLAGAIAPFFAMKPRPRLKT